MLITALYCNAFSYSDATNFGSNPDSECMIAMSSNSFSLVARPQEAVPNWRSASISFWLRPRERA